MYTNKDKILDAIGAVLISAMFVGLWCAGAILDLANVGM